ncbi:N/A [soil metagenome]
MNNLLAQPMKLHVDEVVVLSKSLGIESLPSVLSVRTRYRTVDERESALGRAKQNLISRNVIDDAEVCPEVADLLQAMQRPNRELAMRLVTPDGTARISVVRRGAVAVLARRVNDNVSVHDVAAGTDLRNIVTALLAELPKSPPAVVESVGGSLVEMSECLSGTHDAVALADRVRTLGVSTKVAVSVGAALSNRLAFAEIVYHALARGEDMIRRVPAAAAVFYTRRGRLVAVPSVNQVGQAWVTLKAGSDHAFSQAISQLIELSAERWEGH